MVDLKQLINNGDIEKVNSLKETYYIMEDGTQIGLGYLDGYGRHRSHRDLFDYVKDVARDDFRTLLTKYRLIGCCPEQRNVWYIEGQELSEQ